MHIALTVCWHGLWQLECTSAHPRLLLPWFFFFQKAWDFTWHFWLLWEVLWPANTRGGGLETLAFGPTPLSLRAQMHITVTLLGGVKECWPSFGSAAPCWSQSIPELSVSAAYFSFCTARPFCTERSIALICGSLQQVMQGRALRWHYTGPWKQQLCGSDS